MLIPIGKITKQLGIKSFQIHKWEQRGWLGFEPVLKDPDNNGQRIYSEEQVNRINFIHEEIETQRKEGIKRTDFGVMEKKLLEKFGGEIKEIESKELMVLPASAEEFQKMMVQQQKEIHDLKQMISKLIAKELPSPVDHSQDIMEIKKELQHSRKREEKIKQLEVELEQERKEKENLLNKEKELLLLKKQIEEKAVEEKVNAEEKKPFFKRWFG